MMCNLSQSTCAQSFGIKKNLPLNQLRVNSRICFIYKVMYEKIICIHCCTAVRFITVINMSTKWSLNIKHNKIRKSFDVFYWDSRNKWRAQISLFLFFLNLRLFKTYTSLLTPNNDNSQIFFLIIFMFFVFKHTIILIIE